MSGWQVAKCEWPRANFVRYAILPTMIHDNGLTAFPVPLQWHARHLRLSCINIKMTVLP